MYICLKKIQQQHVATSWGRRAVRSGRRAAKVGGRLFAGQHFIFFSFGTSLKYYLWKNRIKNAVSQTTWKGVKMMCSGKLCSMSSHVPSMCLLTLKMFHVNTQNVNKSTYDTHDYKNNIYIRKFTN